MYSNNVAYSRVYMRLCIRLYAHVYNRLRTHLQASLLKYITRVLRIYKHFYTLNKQGVCERARTRVNRHVSYSNRVAYMRVYMRLCTRLQMTLCTRLQMPLQTHSNGAVCTRV